MVYGRLSHDNEVVAIKAAGVHLFTILKPALLLGVITTLATASLYHTIIPRRSRCSTSRSSRTRRRCSTTSCAATGACATRSLPYVLYVRDVQGKRLIDVVIKRRAKVKDAKTGPDVLIGYDFVARMHEARLRVDLAAGKVSIDPDRFVIYEKNASGATASTGPFTMDLPGLGERQGGQAADQRADVGRSAGADRRDGRRARRARRAQRDRASGRHRAHSRTRRSASSRRARLKHFQFQVDTKTRQIRNLQAEIYARPALAVGCLVFALIGCPVGIWANRADYLSTFVICFLPDAGRSTTRCCWPGRTWARTGAPAGPGLLGGRHHHGRGRTVPHVAMLRR